MRVEFLAGPNGCPTRLNPPSCPPDIPTDSPSYPAQRRTAGDIMRFMHTRWRPATATLISLILLTAAPGCTRGPSARSVSSPPTCSQLLTAAINYGRYGKGDIDVTMQALTDNCSNEYEIAVDYFSNSRPSGPTLDPCDRLLHYGVRSEAVALLKQDGLCVSGGDETEEETQWPEGGLGWYDARAHVGAVQRVCGPLMSGRETADGTFLNVGRDYPSPDRFTFIFWDVYMEPIPPGTTVCGRGEIFLYEGVTQMEMEDLGALELWSRED